jgi:hypothetical protein
MSVERDGRTEGKGEGEKRRGGERVKGRKGENKSPQVYKSASLLKRLHPRIKKYLKLQTSKI